MEDDSKRQRRVGEQSADFHFRQWQKHPCITWPAAWRWRPRGGAAICSGESKSMCLIENRTSYSSEAGIPAAFILLVSN